MKKQIKKVASKVKGITKKAYKAIGEDTATAIFIGASIVDLSIFGYVLASNFSTKKKIKDGVNGYIKGYEAGQLKGAESYGVALSNYLIGSGKTKEETDKIVNEIIVPITSIKKQSNSKL